MTSSYQTFTAIAILLACRHSSIFSISYPRLIIIGIYRDLQDVQIIQILARQVESLYKRPTILLLYNEKLTTNTGIPLG